MRVLVYPEKVFEEFGAVRFDVTTELVKAKYMDLDDIDPDVHLEYVHVPTKTRDAALKAAQKLLQHDRIAFGSVRVQKQVVDWFVEEDRVAEWTDVGDHEEFCSDDFKETADVVSTALSH